MILLSKFYRVARACEHGQLPPVISPRYLPLLFMGFLFLLSACNKLDATGQDVSAKAVSDKEAILPGGDALTVYKSPSCGCCTAWVEHLDGEGFKTSVIDREDMQPIKQEFGVPRQLQSCHTATLGAYVFEGHVPAEVMHRFIAEQPPQARGLTVPGMPIGSPGMEMGDRIDPYEILLMRRDGTTEIYARVSATGAISFEQDGVGGSQ